jgi:hypothetical protein
MPTSLLKSRHIHRWYLQQPQILWLLATMPKKLRLPVFHSYFLFVASSHKICGKEGSLIVWLLVVPVYDVTPPTAKLGPARMFQM